MRVSSLSPAPAHLGDCVAQVSPRAQEKSKGLGRSLGEKFSQEVRKRENSGKTVVGEGNRWKDFQEVLPGAVYSLYGAWVILEISF